MKPSEWAQHITYVYRLLPAPSICIGKCGELFLLPDNSTVRIADQEALEFALNSHYGGGTYRLIVKRGSQRVTEGKFDLGGPIKNVSPIDLSATNSNVPQAGNLPGTDSATAAVARAGFDALGMQERQSAEIGFRAMSTAAEVMQRFASTPQNGEGLLIRELLAEMRSQNRGMNLPEILAAITSVIAILKDVGILGANGVGNGLVEKLLGSAVDRFLHPEPNGAPVSASAELVRVLPTIGGAAIEGLKEWRLGMEAQRDAIAMSQRQLPAAQPVRPSGPNPQVIPPSQPAQNPQPPGAPTVAQQELSAELIETRIVEMLKANVPATQAAEDLYHFLEVGQGPNGQIIPQLSMLGETGLVNLFSKRPILQPAWKMNSPRCVEFIRAFLKYASEEGNPAPGGTA